MKNYIVTIAILFTTIYCSFAQIANVSSTEFNGKLQPSVSADFQMPANITIAAVKQKLSEMKIKGGSDKNGFINYSGIIINEIRPEKMDVYFKVEDKKTYSTLHMLMSNGYENFLNNENNGEEMKRAITFVSNMNKNIMRYGYTEEIKKEEEKLKDAEKDLKKSVKNGESLQKDKSKAESKISANKQEIAKAQADKENQEKTLEFVKAKTGTVDQMNAIKKEISKQEDAVKKAGKNYQKALDNEKDYTKDLEKTNEKINENQTEQSKLKSDIEQIKSKIAEVKGKMNAY